MKNLAVQAIYERENIPAKGAENILRSLAVMLGYFEELKRMVFINYTQKPIGTRLATIQKIPKRVRSTNAFSICISADLVNSQAFGC